MAKVKVKITKGRKFGNRKYEVGEVTSMDKAYFETSGNRFAEKIGSKEVTVEDEKPKKSKKKKNEDKELVAETK